MKHKSNHVEVVNKRSSYNIIYLKEKPALLKSSAENARINKKQNQKGTDLELKNFQMKINGLYSEMKKIEISLNEFLTTVTFDFNDLIKNLLLMRLKMIQTLDVSGRSTKEVEQWRAHFDNIRQQFEQLSKSQINQS